MAIFKNKHFVKRDYECTNVVAVVADNLPARFNAAQWIATDESALAGLTALGTEHSNGERFELYGFL